MDVKDFQLVKNIMDSIKDGAIVVSKADVEALMDNKAFAHLMALLTGSYYSGILSLQKSAKSWEDVRYAQGYLDAMESFISLPKVILSNAKDKLEPSVDNLTKAETVRTNLEDFTDG